MDNDEVDLWATDEVHFQQHGSRCRMWGTTGNQGPRAVASSDAPQRRILWCGAVARWKVSVFSGNGQIQRDDLLCLPEDVTPHEYPERPFRRGHYGQRQIPSCPASQKMARRP